MGNLVMPLLRRSRFVVGVYDPNIDDSWPYFHPDEGVYLSRNKRLCSQKSAIEFDIPDQAREFFGSWKHSYRYALHVLEYKTYIDVPEPVFPDDHPRSILKRIRANEHSGIAHTAFDWLSGSDFFRSYSKSTLARHRNALLKYGIDIYQKPTQLLEPLSLLHEDTWYLAKPNFSIV